VQKICERRLMSKKGSHTYEMAPHYSAVAVCTCWRPAVQSSYDHAYQKPRTPRRIFKSSSIGTGVPTKIYLP